MATGGLCIFSLGEEIQLSSLVSFSFTSWICSHLTRIKISLFTFLSFRSFVTYQVLTIAHFLTGCLCSVTITIVDQTASYLSSVFLHQFTLFTITKFTIFKSYLEFSYALMFKYCKIQQLIFCHICSNSPCL